MSAGGIADRADSDRVDFIFRRSGAQKSNGRLAVLYLRGEYRFSAEAIVDTGDSDADHKRKRSVSCGQVQIQSLRRITLAHVIEVGESWSLSVQIWEQPGGQRQAQKGFYDILRGT